MNNRAFRWNILLWTVGFVIIAGSVPALSQHSTARFLYWRPFASSNGFGGLGTASVTDVSSMYFNPAELAFSPEMSVVASFGKPFPFFRNIAHSNFSASIRFNESDAVGVSTNIYWMGRQSRTTLDPTVIAGEDLTDWEAKISYAHSFSGNLSLGAGFSVLRTVLSQWGTGMEQGSPKSTTVMLDLGAFATTWYPEATWTPFKDNTLWPEWLAAVAGAQRNSGVSVGLSLLNLGPKISFIDEAQADPPPTWLSFGVAYYPIQSEPAGFMISTDIEDRVFEGGTIDFIHYGSELTLLRIFALRLGYVQDIKAPIQSYPTYGLGVKFRYVTVNVAHYTLALLPTWQYDATLNLEY